MQTKNLDNNRNQIIDSNKILNKKIKKLNSKHFKSKVKKINKKKKREKDSEKSARKKILKLTSNKFNYQINNDKYKSEKINIFLYIYNINIFFQLVFNYMFLCCI